MIAEQTIGGFCAELAARTPSPGGGATAAVVGALGTAQLLMVARYGRDSSEIDGTTNRLESAAARLLRLADEDAEAYAEYKAAPKGDRQARERIASVPKAVLKTAQAASELIDAVAERAPSWFAVDVSIARASLAVCIEGARALVEVNS